MGIFCKKKQDTPWSVLLLDIKLSYFYFKMLVNLANSRSFAALVANDGSFAMALLRLLLTNDSLLVRAPTIAIK